jgi:hypothetical protein
MSCSYCERQIPADAKICPHCGRSAPIYYSASGTGPDEPTKIRQPSDGMVGDHDLPLSSMLTPHMSSSDPYDSPIPPPPPVYNANSSISPPPSHYNLSSSLSYPPDAVPQTASVPVRREGRWLLNVGVGLLILLLLAGGGFVYFSRAFAGKATGQSQIVSASVQPSSASVTMQPATVDARTLYSRITSRTPVLASPLSGPDSYGWDDYAQSGTHCWFTGGAYHSKAAPKYFSPCYAQATNFSNFLFQASMTMLSGHSGGLIFRADSRNDNGYYFRLGTDGTYILNKLVPNSLRTLLSGSSAAINKGMNQTNVLAVLVRGNRISLFVNKKYIESITDNSYQAGQIGIYTDSDAGNVEASFHQAQVWNV